jgi:hypothetical protein
LFLPHFAFRPGEEKHDSVLHINAYNERWYTCSLAFGGIKLGNVSLVVRYLWKGLQLRYKQLIEVLLTVEHSSASRMRLFWSRQN